MTDELGFSIATIGIFVFIIDTITKTVFKSIGKESWYRFIPLCSLIYGLVLGVAGYYIPDVEMGNNIIEAIFIGLAAGSGSTGIHQLYRQQIKAQKEEENKKK